MAYPQRTAPANGPVVVLGQPDRIRRAMVKHGAILARRSQLGDLGFPPAAVPAALSLAGKVKAGVKSVLGIGSDPTTDQHRIETTQRALDLARQGNLAAFLFLRARTNGFNHPKFLIPVPPIPGITAGGKLTGWGSKTAEKFADQAYKSVRAMFPQVPENGNVILAVPGGQPQPPVGGGGDPGVVVAQGGGGGGGGGGGAGGGGLPGGDTATGATDAGTGAPAQAGFTAGKFAAVVVGAGILGMALAGGPRRRGRG